jgi:hypothetical protein
LGGWGNVENDIYWSQTHNGKQLQKWHFKLSIRNFFLADTRHIARPNDADTNLAIWMKITELPARSHSPS